MRVGLSVWTSIGGISKKLRISSTGTRRGGGIEIRTTSGAGRNP